MTVTVAGGVPARLRSPPPGSVSSSSSWLNDASNEGQCSRSKACRSRSPRRAAPRPHAPAQIRSVQASSVWMPRGSRGGTEVAITTCAKSPVTDSVSHRHSASSAISRAPSTTRRLRESSMTTRTSPSAPGNVRANDQRIPAPAGRRGARGQRGPMPRRPARGPCPRSRRRRVPGDRLPRCWYTQ